MVDGLIGSCKPRMMYRPVNLETGEFTILRLAEKIIELTAQKSKIIFKDLPADDRGSESLISPSRRQYSPGNRRCNWKKG
jgi:hypothetical protein